MPPKTRITEEMIRNADAVMCMSANHARTLTERFPEEKEKIFVLPLEIPDPFGEDPEVYRACAERLRDALRMLM